MLFRIYGKNPLREYYLVYFTFNTKRKEFARNLKWNYNLNQKQIAEVPRIAPAAVCQYLFNKHGHTKIKDEEILNEIDKSVRIVLERESTGGASETSRICDIFRLIGFKRKLRR
ncbi:MAG: hypothetical protein ACOC80_10725 [Petrotogales bacterium]